jgi:hypothetical protein
MVRSLRPVQEGATMDVVDADDPDTRDMLRSRR